VQKSDRIPILRLDGLRRSFKQGTREINVLRGASAALHAGEVTALVGPSGSGKSTLLHICGLLETPDEGRVVLNGRDCGGLNDADRTRLRRQTIGFVYQFHQLLPEFSALENVVMPQLILGKTKAQAEKRSRELLDTLGLKDRMDHRPAELSGGEQQRTAIARGLANAPKLLLADEPTGNLDPETAERVFAELVSVIRSQGVAALIATHNMELAHSMNRILRMGDGLLHEVEVRRAPA
jgi:lipoprotein-releasing system ATP-binding protein